MQINGVHSEGHPALNVKDVKAKKGTNMNA